MNVDELLSGARDAISVRRVFGEPIEHEGTVVVPVAKVGGGGGGGSDSEHNGGGGFGLGARPVGVYVIKDGQVSWRPAIDPVRVAFLVVAALALLLRAGRR
jgi:uncharacterized spore protein YtfJ